MESLNKKDPYIMLSVLNMKLRDECGSLEDLCRTYDADIEEIIGRMDGIGYSYNEDANQFI